MPPRSNLRTWLQLFRAPNLFTVPGDPVAGYVLAAGGAIEWPLALAIAASLCLYGSGLLLNDLADLNEDRAERPNRPLPSGAASVGSVRRAMFALVLVALALCGAAGVWTLGVGVALAVAVATYNLFSKHLPFIGALNMGACRGLSVLLGATVVPHGAFTIRLIALGRLDHLVVAIALVTLYIAAVTNLARFETRETSPAIARLLPVLTIIAGCIGFLHFVNGPNQVSTLALFLLAIAVSARTAFRISSNARAPLPPAIGQFIRLLLLIQAAFCAAAGDQFGSIAAAVLVVLWPVSRAVGKKFYAS